MTIKRNINGQEMEIELTSQELWSIYEMHRMENMIEECDAIIPYLEEDEGFGEAKHLFETDEGFRKSVAEAYGKYWDRYIDDNTADARFDCVVDALSAAMKSRRGE